MSALTIALLVELPLDRVADLLCSALEGGSNYWYRIETFHAPPARDFVWDEKHVYRHVEYPLSHGGALIFSTAADGEDDGKRYRLDLHSVLIGLRVFREKFPRHFGDWLAENDDADTGDAFLQCCLFGEMVYG